MKILIVTQRKPNLLGKADQITVAKAIDHLKKIGSDVDILVLKQNKIYKLNFWIKSLFGLFILRPLQTSLYINSFNTNRFNSLLTKNKYDRIYFHTIRSSYLINESIQNYSYLGMQLSQGLNFSRISKELSFGIKKFLYYLESRICLNYERKIIKKFRKTNVVGSQDVEYLNIDSEYKNKLTMIPHGVDYNFNPQKKSNTELIYIANFASEANKAGLDLLESEIMPAVWSYKPDISLAICGFNIPKSRIKDRDIRIRYIGSVEHALSEISKYQILLNPVRAAAGMQNKVLSGLSAGIPVVTFRSAVAGMDLSHEILHIVDQDSNNFAKSIIDILDNYPSKIARDDAQNLIKSEWSWDYLHKRWAKEFLNID